jgi:hypothetical protein
MPILPYDDEKQGSGRGLSRLPDVVRAQQSQQQSGGPGFLGTLARGIVAPLTLIDTPRRAIISGIRETVDLLDSDPETKASFGDFLEQTKDPTYGVGSAFPDPTGNKWVDRLIGFAGDVALDPITYATLGAGKGITLAGRAAQSTDLLRAAQAVGRVDEARPLIQKIGQRSVNALSRGERQLYDDIIRAGRIGTGGAGSEIGQAGIRFRVPFTGRETAAIPGTQRVAEGIGGALSSARLRAGQSNLGQRVRTAVSPRERVDLYNQMIKGGDSDTLLLRLQDIAGGDLGTATRNIALNRLGEQVDDIAKTGRKEGLSGEELTRQLTSESVETGIAAEARGFLNKGVAELSDAGSEKFRRLPDGTYEGYRKNYVPRVYTDEYDTVVRGEFGDEIRQTVGVVDDLSQEGITQTRQINAGDTLSRGDQSVVLAGDDPFSFNKAMNELYPELGGSVKFVEEDGYKLLQRWARSASAELGRLRYADEITRFGPGRAASQATQAPRVTGQIAEETAGTVPDRIDDIRAARAETLAEARTGANEARRAETARIGTEVTRAEGASTRLQVRAKAAFRDAQRRVGEIRGEVDRIDQQIARLQGKQNAAARRQLRDRSNRRARLLAEQRRIEAQLPELQARSEAAEALLRQSDEATAAGVRPPGVSRPTGAAIRATERAEGRLAEVGEQLSALGRGGEGVLPDQGIADEIAYFEAKRPAAAAADPFADQGVRDAIDRSRLLEEEANRKASEAIALRARDPQALADNPRTSAAGRRRRRAQAAESRARRQVNAAAKDGFAPSLDGEDAAANIAANLKRVPEQGNKRLRREARALVEDVPEGELLTRDERYLAGLRQAAKDPSDLSAQVAYANMLQAYSIETKIAAEGGKGRNFGKFFESLSGNKKNSAQFREDMLNQLEEGWRMIEGTGVAVPDELYRMRQRIVELNQPEAFTGFLKAWETYTRLFKAYVTATPRFHIRNGMSASFMNWSEGVSSMQMIEGVRIWKKYKNVGIKGLDAREKTIIESVLASGAGQYDMIEVGLRGPLGTRTSRKVGTNVEGGVRAGLAIKVIDQGGSFDEALSTITRVHFNYSQYSNVDRVARQVFPFWTFMSRNLPLQVTQMWTKPRAYARFNTLIRNIRTDDEETGVVPDYFTEGGGFRLPFNIPGVGQWARPDLGFSRVEEDVERLGDPIRFLADSNPLIKAAVENFAGKQLYKDIPLDDESYVPLQGWQQAILPLLLATGQAEQGPNGYVITPKTEYILDQVNPFGGLFNRYYGEGSRNEGKAIKNLLGATGIPALLSGGGYVRDLTPEVQASQRRREQFEQRDALRKLREIAMAS